MASIISSAVFLAYSLTLKGFFCSAAVSQSTIKSGLHSFGYSTDKPLYSHLEKAFHNNSVLRFSSEKNNQIPYRHFNDSSNSDHWKYFKEFVNGSDKEQTGNREKGFAPDNGNKIIKRPLELVNASYISTLKSASDVLDTSDSNHRETKQEIVSGLSDSIVKRLGNAGTDSSKGYSDQVIYIPVYDVDDSSNVQGTKSGNVVQQYTKHAPQPSDEKKAIGFIGVVFLHKVQSNDGSFSAHEKGVKSAGQKGVLNSNLQHQQVVHDNSPDINALMYALQQAGIINTGSDKTNQQSFQKGGLSIDKNVNNQAYQNHQLNRGNEDWQFQSQQQKFSDTKGTQSHSFEDQARQWQQDNNRGPKEVQQTFISKGYDDDKGTPVTHSSKGQEYPNTRVIPENPLFPPRAISQQNPSVTDKGKSSNFGNNANSAHSKSTPNILNKGIYSQGKATVNWPRGSGNKNNFLITGHDQNFKGNIDSTHHISDVNKGTAHASPKERPVKFIPVIRRFVAGKQGLAEDNGKFASNDGTFLNQGHIQYTGNFNSHVSEPHGHLNYNDPKKGTSNKYDPENQNLVPNKESYADIASQNWEPQPIINNRHESPKSEFLSRNTQVIVPNQQKADTDNYNDNDNYNNQVRYQNVKSSEILNLSPDKNSHFETNKPKSSNLDLTKDDEIIQALRIANLYLQNYQNNFQAPSKNTEPHHSEAKHLETSEPPESRNAKSGAFSDNIRPTTDMRFNALVHEQKDNFKSANQNPKSHFPQKKIGKHIEVDNKRHHIDDMTHRLPEHHEKKNVFPLSSPKMHDKKIDFDDFQSSSPLQNFWQGIENQNKQQVIPIMTYDGSKARDAITSDGPKVNYAADIFSTAYNTEAPNESYIQKENPKLMYDSFQMKDAIIPKYQTRISNPKFEQRFNEQVFPDTVSALAAEINPLTKDSNTNARNEATLIFQGYNNNRNWAPNSHSDRKAHSVNLQQPLNLDRKVYYQEKSNLGQGSVASGIIRANANGDQHDKLSKVWYKRGIDSKRDESRKEDDNKRSISYTISTSDADGADSNGFGGESFW